MAALHQQLCFGDSRQVRGLQPQFKARQDRTWCDVGLSFSNCINWLLFDNVLKAQANERLWSMLQCEVDVLAFEPHEMAEFRS